MASLNSWALTTLADVKESLGIDSGTTTGDNLIIRKINQATDMIESYCGKNNSQHFASTVYTNEEYDGTGTDQLILKNRPVITFTTLQQRDTTLKLNHVMRSGLRPFYSIRDSHLTDSLPHPPEHVPPFEERLLLAEIPGDFLDLKSKDMALARDWKFFTREFFETAFAKNYISTE